MPLTQSLQCGARAILHHSKCLNSCHQELELFRFSWILPRRRVRQLRVPRTWSLHHSQYRRSCSDPVSRRASSSSHSYNHNHKIKTPVLSNSEPLSRIHQPQQPPPLAPFMAATQTRTHAGHSHSHGPGHHHHHHHDTTYLISQNKKDAGVRITRIGLFVNLAMAIGKGIGGYIFHSQALVADAYHALTDLVSDFMTLATVSFSLKPPSSRFPTGYGKVESLGALGVSSLLLCGGVFMGLNATEVLLTQFFPDVAETVAHYGLLGHGHSHGHGHEIEVEGPNIHAAWLAAGSIVAKEWLYHATMKVAKDRKSSVLASNAVHHRIDSLTSIVALITIGGAHVFTDASWLDPVGGLIISMMVIKAGWGNTKTSLFELADISVDDEIKTSVQKATSKALLANITDGSQIQIRDIQGVKSGQNYLMEVELAVPGSWSVEHIRLVEDAVRERVGSRVRGVKRVKVRFLALEGADVDFRGEFIPPDVSPRSSPEPEIEDSNGPNNHNHNHTATGSDSKSAQGHAHKRR